MNLRLTTAEVDAETFVVSATGELDMWSGSALDEALASLGERGARRVVVDVAAVPLIDSAVLGIMMRHARSLRAEGGELVLISDDPRTLRVIEITGLGYLFRLERSLADAIQHRGEPDLVRP